MVKATNKKHQLIKKLLVFGDSFNSHFLVSHLLHRFPPDIEIMWVRSSPDKLPFSFTPSFEILNQLALFETPLEHIVSSCQGNLKTGTVYKNWPSAQGKAKSFFVPYYKDQDLQFNTLQYWLHNFKQDPELPNYWLKLSLPAYTLFEEKKSPAYLKANGKIDAISPIGLQLLSKPFLKITESFLNPQTFRNLSIFNEPVEDCHFDSNGYLKAIELRNHQLSADLFFDCSSNLTLMKKLGSNYEPPSAASYDNIHSTHFSVPSQKKDELPAYDEYYATDSGFIKIDYLYQLKSITYYSKEKIDHQKLIELCIKEGIFQKQDIEEFSSELSFTEATAPFGQRQKIWQKNIVNFSTSQFSSFPLEDFSIKLFNYSIELLKRVFPGLPITDSVSNYFNEKMNEAFDEISFYESLFFIGSSPFGKTYTPLGTVKDKLDLYQNTYGQFPSSSFLFFPNSLSLFAHILTQREKYPNSYNPLLDYQNESYSVLHQLSHKLSDIAKSGESNKKLVSYINKRLKND